jgi:hypothetical protein
MMSDQLWVDHIIEVEPTGSFGGNIVWEWRLWDHLVQDFDPGKDNYGTVAQHPELIDINFARGGKTDWTHTNAIDYNEELDQIVISVLGFCEFWIIDHSTTTAQAASHNGGNRGKGGDLLYRWGNPTTYKAGNSNDQILFYQHDAHWIEKGLPGEGNILLFNNGTSRPEGNFSTIEEITTNINQNGDYPIIPGYPFPPQNSTWTYQATPPDSFYSPAISGTQRLPNGNTLICEGNFGRFFEITPNNKIVWLYVCPIAGNEILSVNEKIPENANGTQNSVFRAYRYGPNYPGLTGKDLTPKGYIEPGT